MEFMLLHVCTVLSLAVLACHAALPAEDYWKSVLPNTPMPKGVKDLLLPEEWLRDKSTSVAVGKGGVNVNAGKGNNGGGTNVNVGRRGGGSGVSVGSGKQGKGTNVGVGRKGGVSVRTGPNGKPVYVGVKPGPDPFQYRYAATENQLHDNPNVAVFFLEKDLHKEAKMKLRFVRSSNQASFLPKHVAETIPFSSSKIQDVLDQFSVKPDSIQADTMKKTIEECEEPGIAGEDKYCATSLESMVDYSTSRLGKDIKVIATEAENNNNNNNNSNNGDKVQEFGISGVEKMRSGKGVVCHKKDYAYAVFYCHKTQKTQTYVVSMTGDDGSKAKAVAVCHRDTSKWNPKHLAFQLLKVKPGTVPICHFLPEDHLVWVPK